MIRYLRPGSVDRLTIAQMAGGLDNSGPGIQGHDLVRSLGSLFPGSRLRYLHAPAIVDTPAIRDAILSDRGVREALRVAAASEVALVGVGTVDADARPWSGVATSPPPTCASWSTRGRSAT